MKRAMSKKVVAMVLLASVMGTTVVSATEITKDESVFVNLKVDGQQEKITVSNWLHSNESNLEINDKSDLSDIKNVKSDEEPIISGDNITWNVEGSDVYYQGKTDKELPLDIDIRYFLDGKEIEAEDLAGKSGKIKIELQVKNKIYKEVDINGKVKKIYTPFTTAAVINLPVDKFSAITVDSGMMLSEGNNNVITFVAFPGLDESLGLSDLGIDTDLKDKLTIEAEVKDFELGPIMITATPNLPDTDKLEKATNIDELNDAINKIKEANEKLNSNSMQEKLSLVKDDDKVNRANILINDAFYAKNIETDKVKDALAILSDDNILKANVLLGDARAISMYKDLLEVTIVKADSIVKDEEFNKLINHAKAIKTQYDDVDSKTKEKLTSLLKGATPENIKKGQNLLKESIAIKNDTESLQNTMFNYISNSPGNNINEKTTNFIKGIDKNIQVASSLLNNSTINQLNGLAVDMNGYASSYLILKAELASSLKAGGIDAFNVKKSELVTMIQGVYGQSDAKGTEKLVKYIQGITPDKLTTEAIYSDVNKIGEYEKSLPSVISGVNSLKDMKPLLDETHNLLAKDGEAEKLAKFFGDLNDPTTKSLIESLGQGLLSLNDEDLQTISNLINGLKVLSSDVENNKDNIQVIEELLNTVESNGELFATLDKFKDDLKKSDALIKQAQSLVGNMSSSEITNVKDMSNRLVSMQQDLKNSEDILRITKDALTKGNVDQARNLLSALPNMENKIGSVEDVLAAKDKVIEASKEYESFSGKPEEMNGKVKFVMKTDEIKVEKKDAKNNQEVKKEKKGFFAWLKSLFVKED